MSVILKVKERNHSIFFIKRNIKFDELIKYNIITKNTKVIVRTIYICDYCFHRSDIIFCFRNCKNEVFLFRDNKLKNINHFVFGKHNIRLLSFKEKLYLIVDGNRFYDLDNFVAICYCRWFKISDNGKRVMRIHFSTICIVKTNNDFLESILCNNYFGTQDACFPISYDIEWIYSDYLVSIDGRNHSVRNLNTGWTRIISNQNMKNYKWVVDSYLIVCFEDNKQMNIYEIKKLKLLRTTFGYPNIVGVNNQLKVLVTSDLQFFAVNDKHCLVQVNFRGNYLIDYNYLPNQIKFITNCLLDSIDLPLDILCYELYMALCIVYDES